MSNWLKLPFSELDGVLPMFSPPPNPITALVQQQLRRSIEEAAALAGSQDGHKLVHVGGIALDGPWDVPDDQANPDGRWCLPDRTRQHRPEA